ncbi:GroES-like protein [Xylona heveae TC161]|uniref:GroES-like protein n=1 Tax=Xylona heveae (strain CBS 132557 / TC161) TaxID=1328760 RepID=A0A165FV98_XYLHT|nr:GroES-like protein [Xylona heveae TC161]KZF21421.1 GroES-like protein [Xylona heveae TC161]
MKNLIVISEPPHLETKLEDIDPPTCNDDQVIIKVAVAGANPKDWKHPAPNYFNVQLNQGDDAAGTIHATGKNVSGFRIGDRVAGFHQMDTLGETYAEYTVVSKDTVFRIPDHVSFEEAATIPLAAYTAAVGLFRLLKLPQPWEDVLDETASLQGQGGGREKGQKASSSKIPLIINGASTSVGSFAIKLAKLHPSISPIIAVAGASSDYVKTQLLGGERDAVVLDYRSATIREDIVAAVANATGASGATGHTTNKVRHVFDASNSTASTDYLSSVLEPGVGRYVCTTGITEAQKANLTAKKLALARQIWVGCVHEDKEFGARDFGYVWANMFAKLLQQKRFSGHPYEVVPQGLHGVEGALKQLMNRTSGRGNAKFVFRIADTPGL